MSITLFRKSRRTLDSLVGACALAGLLLTAAAASAVTAPYAENFDSYPSGAMPDNFVVQTNGGGVFFSSTWNIDNPSGTAGIYRNNAAGDFVYTAAAVDVSNLAQRDFVLSTTFVVDSYGSFSTSYTDIRAGLLALAPGVNLTSSGYQLSYELLDKVYGYPVTGALAISGSGIVKQSTGTLPVATGVTYLMTLSGSYSPTGLLLTGSLSDGTNEISVSSNFPFPQTGTYFGYYDKATGLTNQGAFVNVDYDNFSLTAGAGASLASAASVLYQGSAGGFAIDMPLTGPSGVEDRSALTYNAVFTFDRLVTSGEVTVAEGTANIASITFSGNTMTAALTGVTPAEIVTLHLQNINGDGQADGDVPFGFLVGDADADRIVRGSDQQLLKSQRNQTVTSANFREDINIDGRISGSDLLLIKSNKGQSLP